MLAQNPAGERRRAPIWLLLLSYAANLALIAVFFGGAGYGSYYLMTNKSKAKKRAFEQEVFVETAALQVADQKAVVSAMGTVVPSQQIDLYAQVSGLLVAVSPSLIPGGTFRRGEVVAKIDPRDYELALAQRRNSLQSAISGLRIEEGRQTLAIREYALLGKELAEKERELVLRKPQLIEAQQGVANARSAVQKAELDMERTSVLAPFDALVLQKYVGPGSTVTPSSKLATLVDAREYWVEVSTPPDRLEWLKIPRKEGEPGSPTRISNPAWKQGAFRVGHVKRMIPSLESQGRMARLLVSVEDPLGEKGGSPPPLLLGSFVSVEIDGKTLPGLIRVAREWLRDGKYVWVQKGGTLDVREVEIAWKDRKFVYVSSGVADGERIVTSEVPGAVHGMKISEVQP